MQVDLLISKFFEGEFLRVRIVVLRFVSTRKFPLNSYGFYRRMFYVALHLS